MAKRLKVLVLYRLLFAWMKEGGEEGKMIERNLERILDGLKEGLPPEDYEVVLPSSLEVDEVARLAADVDVILGSSVPTKVIEAAKNLRLIHAIGAGVERIDIKTAAEKGILICNSAGLNAIPVAEHAISLLLACAKRLLERHNRLAGGEWVRGQPSAELYGKTLGIVGLGSIGIEVAKRMKPFQMRIIAIKRHSAKQLEAELGMDYLGGPGDLDYVLENSDFIVLAVPNTTETRHMIGRRELSKIKKTAFIINISRGIVIDEEALIQTLKEGKIAGAGLDVYQKEPIDPSNPLLKLSNVVLTPHVAAYTFGSVWETRMKFITGNIRNVMEGKRPINIVSPELKYAMPESSYRFLKDKGI